MGSDVINDDTVLDDDVPNLIVIFFSPPENAVKAGYWDLQSMTKLHFDRVFLVPVLLSGEKITPSFRFVPYRNVSCSRSSPCPTLPILYSEFLTRRGFGFTNQKNALNRKGVNIQTCVLRCLWIIFTTATTTCITTNTTIIICEIGRRVKD